MNRNVGRASVRKQELLGAFLFMGAKPHFFVHLCFFLGLVLANSPCQQQNFPPFALAGSGHFGMNPVLFNKIYQLRICNVLVLLQVVCITSEAVLVGSSHLWEVFRSLVFRERVDCFLHFIKCIISLNGFALCYNDRNTVCDRQITLILVILASFSSLVWVLQPHLRRKFPTNERYCWAGACLHQIANTNPLKSISKYMHIVSTCLILALNVWVSLQTCCIQSWQCRHLSEMSQQPNNGHKHMTNLVTSVDFIGSAMRLFPLLTVEETCCFKVSSERSSDGKLN